MADQPTILQMRNITKAFGPVVANNGISLSLRRGEVLGLLGENGAGKSTLMKILYGLYRPDAGEILVDGRVVEIRSPRDAVAQGIGMVHQHFTLIPPLTVAENIVLGAEPHRGALLDLERAVAEVEELSGRYGLSVNPRARVADLSVGVQQRVEILKALYREVSILVLDEPTAGLTPQESEELFGVLGGLVEQGLSIIFITHRLGELLETSSRITVIRDGAVVDTVATEDADERLLARLMVGREVLLRIEERPEVEVGAPRLQARGLVVGAQEYAAVDGVDLTVAGGEIVGIAGVDGNGQLELAEALAGSREAKKGEILLDGRDVTGTGPAERRRSGLAYIPEDRQRKGLVGEFTLAENLVMKSYNRAPFSRWGWLFPGRMRREAAGLLRDFDVRPPDPEAKARSLSGGNQQKVVLARELSGDPAVIIAAQPTRGLDVGAIEFVHRRLLEERAAGKAILLISLDLEEVRSLSDRILVMYGGRLVGEVSGSEATDERLGLLMAGRTGG